MIKKNITNIIDLLVTLLNNVLFWKIKYYVKLTQQGKIDLEDVTTSHFISRTSQLCGKEIKFANTIQFGSSDPIEVLNFIWSVPFQVPHNIQEPIMIVWTPHFVLMRFPLDGELDFYSKNYDFYFIKKMTWSRHLFLFYF